MAKLVEERRKIADARGATVAQLAIAWVLAQGKAHNDIVALVGAKTPRRLAEALPAAELTLAADELHDRAGARHRRSRGAVRSRPVRAARQRTLTPRGSEPDRYRGTDGAAAASGCATRPVRRLTRKASARSYPAGVRREQVVGQPGPRLLRPVAEGAVGD